MPTRSKLPSWWNLNLQRIPHNNVFVDYSFPLGLARQKLISKVGTEWFAFVDDDVLVGEDWFNQLTRHIRPDVGAVDGREQYGFYNVKMTEALNAYRKSKGDFCLKLGERGRTVCTLLRSSVVKDWKPSRSDLSSWEDYELTQHVIKKGFRWLDVHCDATHFGWGFGNAAKKSLWHTEGLKKVCRSRQYSFHRYMLRLCCYPPWILLKTLFRKPPRTSNNMYIAVYSMWSNMWIVLGLIFK